MKNYNNDNDIGSYAFFRTRSINSILKNYSAGLYLKKKNPRIVRCVTKVQNYKCAKKKKTHRDIVFSLPLN